MNLNFFNRRQLLGLGTASLGALTLSRVAQAQNAAPAAGNTKPPATSNAPLTATPSPDATPPANEAMTLSASDAALLSSALSVEQAGAAFYSQVLGAHQRRAYLNERLLAAATEMAQTKAAHVATIQGALAGAGTDAGTFKFPYTSFVSPLAVAWLGYTLEEIAIGSHLDTLERIQARSLRSLVATIIGTDSGHAALLRVLSGFEFSPRYFEAKLAPSQVNALLSTYRV